jgi:hypothetical protein
MKTPVIMQELMKANKRGPLESERKSVIDWIIREIISPVLFHEVKEYSNRSHNVHISEVMSIKDNMHLCPTSPVICGGNMEFINGTQPKYSKKP